MMERSPGVIEPMAYYYNHLLLLVVVVVAAAVSISNMEVMMVVDAQQAYVSNHQLDCYNQAFNSSTLGYLCNGLRPSCPSYLTFRSTPLYNSPALIAYLLGASQSSAPLIASLNNISSDTAPVPTDSLLIAPVPCSCSRRYYQHNATYLLKSSSETYFTVANNTYQGLTTCQALMDQNPFGDRDLLVGMDLSIPLRCACPTRNQTSSGIKYLLSYMVTWGDSLPSIAQLFGADLQALRDANQLSSSSIIFPFTPILVPLTAEPTSINQTPSTTATPDPPPAPQIPITPGAASNNKRKPIVFVYVGVGVGTVVLLLFAVSLFLFWRNRGPVVSASLPKTTTVQVQEPSPYSAVEAATDAGTSWSLSSHDAQHAVESLTLYKFEELEAATRCFSEANRIKGAVYKGSFKGDAAAVKIVKGDVSGGEINLLKMLNHSNIIRLSGFCVDRGNTYLVYEYAEKGSLSDWLRVGLGFYRGKSAAAQPLLWKQRVQIAFQVADALNYLHNYTTPPHIHKNLNTSNILLDANLRAKIANFGLARMLDNQVEGGNGALQLTRHVVGTQGYMPPEYIENGVITPKMDVFALGVVLLELLSGKEAVIAAAADGDKNAGNQLLSAVIKQVLEGDNVRDKLRAFLDPSLENDYPLDLAFSMAQLAKSCVALDLNARPSMSQALFTLSKILSSSLDWDPSDPNDLQNSTSSSIAGR